MTIGFISFSLSNSEEKTVFFLDQITMFTLCALNRTELVTITSCALSPVCPLPICHVNLSRMSCLPIVDEQLHYDKISERNHAHLDES